ncbi:MAG: DUF2207 domain-containing protein [Caldisericum sp.]|nr:DUF2207 domain-containing protein [Caldisericum sp.]
MKKYLIMSLLLFLFFFSSVSSVSAKDYYFPKVTITIHINDDGTFDVEELRTYKFYGSFHWATYTLDKSGFDEIEDFTIGDETGPYKRTYTETNTPGTFIFLDLGDKYYAKFFYDASDTTKTFTIKYRVIGGIKVYKDVADFYWKLIGTGWDKKTSDFEGFVYLPQPVQNEDDLKVFGHGPLNGIVERIDGTGAHYKVTNVPPNTYIEARVLFPPSVLPKAGAFVIPEEKLNQIMQEELTYAKKSDEIKSLTKTGVTGLFLLWISFFAFYLFLFFTFGKEPTPQREIIYTREIPEDIPPAIVGYLTKFNKQIDDRDLAATILYLVKKGYIALETKDEERNYIIFDKTEPVTYFYKTDKDPSTLSGHLAFAYDFLFNVIGEGKNFVSTDMIKKFAKLKSHTAYNMFQIFERNVNKDGSSMGYFENRVVVISIYIAVLFLVSVISFVTVKRIGITLAYPLVWLLIGISVLLAVTLQKRTQKGAEAFAEWMGLKRFLNDFSNLKEYVPTSIVIWEDYLIYATTFGIAQNVLKYLNMNIDKIPQEEWQRSYIFSAALTPSGTINTSSLNAFHNSLSSAFSTLGSSTKSSSTGSGGGFSSGGGGGGGGSGGGAG